MDITSAFEAEFLGSSPGRGTIQRSMFVRKGSVGNALLSQMNSYHCYGIFLLCVTIRKTL